MLTPPNALAFEHSGIDTPEGFVPAEPGAAGMTARYGVATRGADAVATESLDASKVLVAIERAEAARMGTGPPWRRGARS